MLASGRMPTADWIAAMRTLVAMALRRGDQVTAIDQLEALLQLAPPNAAGWPPLPRSMPAAAITPVPVR
jgi:hypothetical protein